MVRRIRTTFARSVGKRAGYALEEVFDLRNFTPDHAAFVRTLFQSQFDYIPQRYFGPVVVCVAKTQPLAALVQVESAWCKIAPAAVISRFDGTHSSLVHTPDVAAVAEYLKKTLAGLNEAQAA
jgi:hypothetical protein